MRLKTPFCHCGPCNITNDNPEMLRLQAGIRGVRGALYKSKVAQTSVFEVCGLTGLIRHGAPTQQGRVKVAEKAALPPAVLKASGFPAQTASLLPLSSAGRLSLPAEPRGLVRAEALGKAKPFRTAGVKAAFGCYLSGTLTRPWPTPAAVTHATLGNAIMTECLSPCALVASTAGTT
jgi:hypothetical protein